MSSATTQLRPHAAPVPPEVRRERRSVIGWALANGRPVERDALCAVVAARRSTSPDGAPLTTGDVGVLLWVGIAAWCRARGADLPAPGATRRSLLTYVEYLAATGELPEGSDSAASLREAVTEYAGQDRPARSSRHPAARSARTGAVLPMPGAASDGSSDPAVPLAREHHDGRRDDRRPCRPV